MHLYGITRGIIQQRDDWLAQMRAQKFPWERTNLNVCECKQPLVGHLKEGCDQEKGEFKARKEIHMVQMSVRPIEFFELTFPETGLNRVLTSLNATNEHTDQMGDGFTGSKLFRASMRKALKCDPIPKIDAVPMAMEHTILTPGFGFNVIGMRKDRTEDVAEWGFGQEML